MTLSLGQMAADLDAGACGTCRACRKAQQQQQKQQAGAAGDPIEAAERLVESVRRIRAVTDEVLDARTRIDEVLQSARDLSLCVSQQPQQPSEHCVL